MIVAIMTVIRMDTLEWLSIQIVAAICGTLQSLEPGDKSNVEYCNQKWENQRRMIDL